ncbi:MAG TPA: amidohydrolase family protein [Solirubrobacteraceae bacterium]|jgi:predicted TIM-barrel fold metal-dependent hydrolase|nr:amidohydrolase family protein [Solirubrobacteraceae bacterium]
MTTATDPYATLGAELAELAPPTGVLDAHTHLGADEDGRSLDPGTLMAALDEVDPAGRAVVFPFHDPERHPAYRLPNDRVLAWARESGGRLIPYCRLDPEEEPVAEAERCLGLGARGIKLHPRAQEFEFGHPAAAAIFSVARDAGVPILIHAGRGMRSMAALVDLAQRFPEVPLVLAHAGIADQAVFAAGLADHPCALYDTSCFGPQDVVELFARVPAERVVFASDIPYGRPNGGLYLAMRVAALAGLDAEDRALVAGGTMAAVLAGEGPPPARPPRLDRMRPASGSLTRIAAYLLMGFGAVIASPPPDPARALPWVALAEAVCRDPDPGAVGPVLERIGGLLDAAESLIGAGEAPDPRPAIGLIHAAATIAATEPVGVQAKTAS